MPSAFKRIMSPLRGWDGLLYACSSLRFSRSIWWSYVVRRIYQGISMPRVSYVFIIIFVLLPAYSYAQNCGFKPNPQFGCKIGRCVNGKWEQVCGGSELDSDAKSINEMIANPRVADIAGALEKNQKRKDAAEARRIQAESEKALADPSEKQTKISTFNELRKTDKAASEMYMLGIVASFNSANSMLQLKQMPPLYCQPQTLVLNLENYMSIFDVKYELSRANIESSKETLNIGVSDVLLFGLIDTFPCEKR